MLDPLISIRLKEQGRVFWPGQERDCEYQVDAVEQADLRAVEASVMWYTEGKGDEDLGIHYFERRVAADRNTGDLRPMRHFRTTLPRTPLSYSGILVKIRWCVRVRIFLGRGRDAFLEVPFQLGDAPVIYEAEVTE